MVEFLYRNKYRNFFKIDFIIFHLARKAVSWVEAISGRYDTSLFKSLSPGVAWGRKRGSFFT